MRPKVHQARHIFIKIFEINFVKVTILRGVREATTMSGFLLPTDLDLCLHPQTHLSFGGCTVRVTWKPTFPDFQKKNLPSGLYTVLDQGMGTKLSDLVVIALGTQTGVLGSNFCKGNSGNCPDTVSFLEKLFFMLINFLNLRGICLFCEALQDN